MTDTTATRMWDHLLQYVYGTTNVTSLKYGPQDALGHALFRAIDHAYSPMGRTLVTVDRALIQYLAGWGRQTSDGDLQQGGPFGENKNHFIDRAYRAFLTTLRHAVKLGQFEYRGQADDSMYGGFRVPAWFVDDCLDEAYQEAEYWNKLIDDGAISACKHYEDGWIFH